VRSGFVEFQGELLFPLFFEENRPVLISLLQVGHGILVELIHDPLAVLKEESAIDDLKSRWVDLDQGSPGETVGAEAPELWFVLGGSRVEGCLMLRGGEEVDHSIRSAGYGGVPWNGFGIREIGNRVVPPDPHAFTVDIDQGLGMKCRGDSDKEKYGQERSLHAEDEVNFCRHRTGELKEDFVTPCPSYEGKTSSSRNTPMFNCYSVRFATTPGEIREALRLRYKVFNLELQEGLVTSHASGLDEDEFDAVCDHLIIVEEKSSSIVGTYRMQSGAMAGRNLGYYSAREFDFSPFDPVRDSLIELGRACVHRDHRSIIVVSMLWKEIVRYVLKNNARYMIGCSSLTSQEPALGHAMYRKFAREGALAEPDFITKPLPPFTLPEAEALSPCPLPPKLLRAYLGVGAKICGEPAIDREFGTIDFLTMLDCHNGSAIATERFLERPNAIKGTTESPT